MQTLLGESKTLAAKRGDKIRSVVAGELWFGRAVMKALAQNRGVPEAPSLPRQDLANRLTRREMDVLEALADGMSNQQISDKLRVTQSTTKHHLTRIFSKLHVSSRLELALLAGKYGLGAKAETLVGVE